MVAKTGLTAQQTPCGQAGAPDAAGDRLDYVAALGRELSLMAMEAGAPSAAELFRLAAREALMTRAALHAAPPCADTA
jgi:hypothetical protein